ncbi:MAG: SpoIIE family protein phosphatase [Bacteroidetes bacterium]|nr:SpoIIE family protein phosphatase [Bacteroidota bacterium]
MKAIFCIHSLLHRLQKFFGNTKMPEFGNLGSKRTIVSGFLFRCSLFLSLFIFSAYGQTGNYYISNFSPSDYGATDQNWCSVQDEYGRIYIANNFAVLLNDGGKEWITVKLRNQSRCISLDKDKNNRIFVGGENEFGYLTTLPNGQIVYQSLSKELPLMDQEFGYVWATRCINDEVFFGSNAKLFWYKNGKVRSFSPDSEGFHTFFTVGDHLFIREKGVGFKVFVDGKLKMVENTENFADQRVDFIMPYKRQTFWVGTRNDGMHLLVYDLEFPWKSVFSKIRTAVDDWLAKNDLYCGAKINEQTYALGSLKGGVLLVDKNFKTYKSISDKDGLLDNSVKNIFVDWNENIWLSLNFGMSFIEFNTPITHWTKNNGIKGVIESSAKFEGHLYIATDKGLQVLNKEQNRFTDTEIGDRSIALLVKNKSLLVGTANGLYSLARGKVERLFDLTVYSILSDPSDTTILYLGTDKGMTIVRYSKGGITKVKSFDEWGDVRSAAKNKEGLIGFGTSSNGVFVLNVNKSYSYQHLTEKEGLPSLIENYIFSYEGELLVGTEKGLYKIINSTTVPQCLKINSLASLQLENLTITNAKQIDNEIWFHGKMLADNQTQTDVLRSVKFDANGVTEKHRMLRRIKGVNARNFLNDSSRVYISTNVGLYCYDNGSSPKQNPFHTFISKLEFKDDTISVLNNLSGSGTYPDLEIPYRSNEIMVVPAAADYYDKNELKFAYYLEGKEEKYGNWTKTSGITYNNLREGSYVFHLKARNVMGQEGNPVTVTFTILPPWYRTMWAYVLYGILTASLIWLIVKLNIKRLKEQNIRLEKVITERTKTIAHQKEEIEHKNQEITDSINYAKRIQDAILPSVREIKKTWNDLFVFFQPKAIVSGDFYWYHKISDDEFLLGAADCTGHGVPGGFMSMICSDKLNEAANISQVPSEILHYANNEIKIALKQSEDENTTKDGMEIALLRINTKTRRVWYTGAYRSLWIVKKGSNDLEEIKPTKASVASNTVHDFKYKLHEMQLSEGDRLYMTSDGYPDQFGGPQGKKYMTANFKKFILSIKDMPIQKQLALVEGNINGWMKGFEQVDDLLVIGIKL